MNDTNPIEVTGSVAPETPERRAEGDTTEVTVPAEATTEDTFVFTFDKEGDTVIITAPENVKVELVTKEPETVRTPTTLDNILTLSLVGVLAIVVITMVIRKFISNKKPAAVEVEQVPAAPAADAPTAPGTAGEVKLNNVDPKTAAMLMAIVADKMQKPINELRFISIKEVE